MYLTTVWKRTINIRHWQQTVLMLVLQQCNDLCFLKVYYLWAVEQYILPFSQALPSIFSHINVLNETRMRRTDWEMVSAFRSCSLIGRKPHPSQIKPNRPIVNGEWLEGIKTCETVLSHCSQPSRKFQHGTYLLRPPSNGTNWQRQASHEWGEKVVRLKPD